VLVQGVLGGLRVTALKDEIGIIHGTFAQLFLVLVWAIALAQTRWWKRIVQGAGAADLARFRKVFLGLALLVLLQLILGASMRHQHAGLAIPDFPLAHGKLWPATDPASLDAYNRARLDVIETHPVTAAHIHLHMTHRVTAVLLLVAAVWLAAKTRRALGGGHPVSRFALAWCGLVIVQAALGAFTVLSNKAADIATLHVVLGALTLLSMALAAVCATRAQSFGVHPLGCREPGNTLKGGHRTVGDKSGRVARAAALPHPDPLPLGEGETASASRKVEARALAEDGIGGSLSQRERVGVRENATPAETAGLGNQTHRSAGH
jgi:heme A synthase